jgi:DNA-binding PadR family transcriptional regulator
VRGGADLTPRRNQRPTIEPPLSQAVFHILLALAAGEMHGYAIMREIAILSDGRIHVGPGTLYGSIKRLLAAGLIEEAAERPDPDLDDERRRYYRLTEDGHRVLTAEAARLAGLVEAARVRMATGPVPAALRLGRA